MRSTSEMKVPNLGEPVLRFARKPIGKQTMGVQHLDAKSALELLGPEKAG